MLSYQKFYEKKDIEDISDIQDIQALYDTATDVQKAYFDVYADFHGYQQYDFKNPDNKWTPAADDFINTNRNINWVSKESFKSYELLDEFEDISGYNEFETSDLLKLKYLFNRDADFYPGREGSPVLYVDIKKTELYDKDTEKIRNTLKASEVNIFNPNGMALPGGYYQGKERLNGMLRIYWS